MKKRPRRATGICGSGASPQTGAGAADIFAAGSGGMRMQIAESKEEVRHIVREWRKEGLSVGLVPTMGYLHEGHRSLIRRAVSENARVVVSDFVNPTQFGVNEDLDSYPRDMERDAAACEEEGASLIFHPSPEEMYFPDHCTFVDMDRLTKGLCGKTRPTHFRGVCTVVSKLFHIVGPDRAYFGQKDAQQLAVIRRMARDLDFDVEIVGCPIVREADGLAMSSRNTYLDDRERKAALVLHRALSLCKEMADAGETDAARLKEAMAETIGAEPLARIDYIEIVDADTMEELTQARAGALVALAAYIGKTRLIDNQIL